MATVQVPSSLRATGAGRFWLAILLTGIFTGLSAIVLARILELVQSVAWNHSGSALLESVEHVAPVRRVLVLLCAGMVVIVGQLVLKHLASGNGIDTTVAIWFHAGRLPMVRTLGSALLSITGVGMGVSLGREGAPQQFGAVLANFFCDKLRLSDEERRLIVACGAGAGMGSAYGVSLGGALYAMEVFRGVLALRYVLPALFTAAVATGVSFLLLPDEPIYVVDIPRNSLLLVIGALVTGVLGGLASVGLVRGVAWADRSKPKGRARFVAPLFALGLLGLGSIAFPQLLGNGRDLAQQVFSNELNLALVLALFVLKPAAAILCIRGGVPGGLFTPSLATGALMGSVVGHALLWVWPETPVGTLSLLGAGSLVSATTQGPISTVVLLMEMTGRDRHLLVPLIITVVVATLVVRTLENRSIYEARLTDEEVKRRRLMREQG